jgi:hypothetical protein
MTPEQGKSRFDFALPFLTHPAPYLILALVCIAHRAHRWLQQTTYYAVGRLAIPQLHPATDSFQMGALFLRRAVRATSTDPNTRILVLNRTETQVGELVYTIVGESGLVFYTTIGYALTCTCPDYLMNRIDLTGTRKDATGVRHCKHIFFVKSEILGMSPDHDMFYRLGYARWELDYIRQHAKSGTHRASWAIQEAVNGKLIAKERDPEEVCSICYQLVGEEPAIACFASCRNRFHSACMDDYRAFCDREKQVLKCPNCQYHPFVVASEPLAKKETVVGREYTSVADVRGIGKIPPKKRRGSARAPVR